MKPQDILFIVVLIALIVIRKPKLLVYAGLICLILSIPFFSFWVFFTAQRLTYYAPVFFFSAILLLLISNKNK